MMKLQFNKTCKEIVAAALLPSLLIYPIIAYSMQLPQNMVKEEPAPSQPMSSSAGGVGIPRTGSVINSPVPSSVSSSNKPPRKQLALPAPVPGNAGPVAPADLKK